MQILINIPDEEDYERLKEYKKAPFCSLTSRAYEAIANGTPLPKGHGRLIDADELEECKEIMNTLSGESKYAVRMDDIRNMSTIIEADKENKE